jgi:hypothetical protein
MTECQPPVGPRVVTPCQNGDTVTLVVPPNSTDGKAIVQGALKWCGTGELVCPESTVSGCITDSDNTSTVYGPGPSGPPSLVQGHSPKMSRVRVNRTNEPALPYTVTPGRRPDQLIDVVSRGGVEVPYDGLTGTFSTPGPETPAGVAYPEDVDGNAIIGMKDSPSITWTFDEETGEWTGTAGDVPGAETHFKTGYASAYTVPTPIEYGTNTDPAIGAGALSDDLVIATANLNVSEDTQSGVLTTGTVVVPWLAIFSITGAGAIGLAPSNVDHAATLSNEISLDGGTTWMPVCQMNSTYRTDDPFPITNSEALLPSVLLAAGTYQLKMRVKYARLSGGHAQRAYWGGLSPYYWQLHRVEA